MLTGAPVQPSPPIVTTLPFERIVTSRGARQNTPTRHSEAYSSYNAEVADWRPGMGKPLCQTGSNEGSDVILVPQADVKEALACLIVGATRRATKLLRKLCPDISELPLFEIV